MVEDAPNYSSFTTAPTEIQSAAAYLEKSLFIGAGELVTRVTVAAKDANGKIYWVNLDPAYHSVLVKTAIDKDERPQTLRGLHQKGPIHCTTQCAKREAPSWFLHFERSGG